MKMLRKKQRNIISKALVVIMIIMTVFAAVPSSFDQMAYATSGETNASDLALQAIRDNYDNFMDGVAVDASWGNFSSYDAHILSEAGVDLSTWVLDDESFKEKSIALIDETIAAEIDEAITNSNAKRVAQDYVAAVSFNEIDKAETLMAILVGRQTLAASGGLDDNPYVDLPAFDLLNRVGALNGSGLNLDDVVTYIVNNQDISGGWPIGYEGDGYTVTSDLMSTVEAVRVLKSLGGNPTDVDLQAVIDGGVVWLKACQQADGSYVAGWDDAVTDTSEIIYTIEVLGEDLPDWTSDEGNSPLDYMVSDTWVNDSFGNAASTTWALDAYLQLGANVSSDSAIDLNLNEEDEEIYVGDEINLVAKALTIDGSLINVSSSAIWSSGDEDIATVDNDGEVIAVGIGEVEITVNYNGYSDSIDFIVTKNPAVLALQAIRNNYISYMDGIAVDASWGNFSSYDAHILAQAGVELSTWVLDDESFQEKSIALIDDTIAAEIDEAITNSNAKRVAQDYIAAVSFNETDKSETLMAIMVGRQALAASGGLDDNPYVDLPAFDLLNRVGALNGSGMDIDQVVTYILNNQDASGGWPIGYEGDGYTVTSDLMSTVEAVRVLETMKGSSSVDGIQAAIDSGVVWLKACQQADGSYVAGWDDAVTDTSEIIYAIEVLGEDLSDWTSSEGNTPVDYMLDDALVNGSFGNAASTTWALDAYLHLGANVSSDSALNLVLNEEEDKLNIGDEITLTAKVLTIDGSLENISSSATWSSDDENIAAVDQDGIVTAINVGEVEITVNYDGYSDSIDFIVNESPSSLAMKAIRNNYKYFMDGVAVDASWGNFSSYDAHILSEAGVNLSTWELEDESFKAKSIALIDETIAAEIDEAITNSNAKRVAQDYIAAVSFNETDKAETLMAIMVGRQTLAASGGLDDNPYVDLPAFDLLNRVGALNGSGMDIDQVVTYILNNQDTSGGWPIGYEGDGYTVTSDLMSTVEAVRVLETMTGSSSVDGIQAAIDSGVIWLKACQQADGSYVAGWDDAVTDTSEIIYAIEVLGEDLSDWTSSEGNTPVDYMLDDALVNGSFGNAASTTWALDAYLQLGASVSSDSILSIEVTPSEKSIYEGKTTQFNAQARKMDGTTQDITEQSTWTSSDESIAEVDENGLVRAVNMGSVIITATSSSCSDSGILNVLENETTVPVDDDYKVAVAIIGENGDVLYGPKNVTVSEDDEYEGSAVSALDATRVSWEYSDDFPGMVIEIDGIRNSGMNGWMYAVNGRVPSALPIDKSVDSGDEILWWFSTSAMEDAPDWPESDSTIAVDTVSVDKNEIKEIVESYNDELGTLIDDQVILNADQMMSEEEIVALEKSLTDNVVDLSQRFLEAETIIADSEVAMLIPANALSEATTIGISELDPAENPNQFAISLGSATYEFSPNGASFDENVTIAITVVIDENTDLDSLVPAWFDEENNQWVPIPCVIDVERGLVIFEIDHFTKFAIIEMEQRVAFSDVDDQISWAKDPIEILAGQGIISGTGNGFEPMRTITRAEYITLIVNAMGIELTESKGTIFSDIDASHWYSDAVETGFNNGIVSGDIEGSFRPNDVISRNEVAVILSNLNESTSGQNLFDLTFTDSSEVPAWALSGVKFVAREGLMIGSGDNMFRGSNTLSRAEAAVVIYSYLNRFHK